ncbi:hypothetical protein SELSPUOL_02484 [Selenomonas sputigena ATCC 35185]|uniref:Uncharacterized protein n=1 Tax=Selenomonas sputigena (strain ATCC 35185 / DSM 20758 / CCUG 44933 / VPI D19B-28) TaxID=546271 RepID=C9LYC5_SELS3|nr:hypothetical protein SELSPUOL_02484 [Selenomonas sputigena ATCC 35185]
MTQRSAAIDNSRKRGNIMNIPYPFRKIFHYMYSKGEIHHE